MNRIDEYKVMINELNRQAPALETTLDRAYRKRRKRMTRMIVHPIAGFAACFAAFVLLVNFCAPVAYACAQNPVLRELAKAVTFSRSLSSAVENEYVQPISLSKTENNITASVEYLIVDQKQVNVFYRLDSEEYSGLEADPGLLNAEGKSPFVYSVHGNDSLQENGELRSVTIDFLDENVPDSLMLMLRVYSSDSHDSNTAPEDTSGSMIEYEPEQPNYLAELEFLLEFDPHFTSVGKVFPVNQTVVLDNQAITITNVEVFPSHMRVEISESEENTAWLKSLNFYIQTDWGMKFDPVSNGIISTGSTNSPSMISYRADSAYFYEADHLKLVITGAKWLQKDMKKTYVNLVSGETEELPDGVELNSAERINNGWVVTFRVDREEDEPLYNVFHRSFYGADGNEYGIDQWSCMYVDSEENENTPGFFDEYALMDYPYDEVWLIPQYSHNWKAKDVVTLTVR